jgi:hypothetical protein
VFFPVIDNEAYNLIDEPKVTGTPERRLLLAMLERSILDFVGNDETEVEQAQLWIFGSQELPNELVTEESPLSPFSFPWVCQQLDLDHNKIASIIREMPRRGNRRVAPWYFMRQSATSAQKLPKPQRSAVGAPDLDSESGFHKVSPLSPPDKSKNSVEYSDHAARRISVGRTELVTAGERSGSPRVNSRGLKLLRMRGTKKPLGRGSERKLSQRNKKIPAKQAEAVFA